MEQEAIQVQNTSPKNGRLQLNYAWMRHFFSDDTTPQGQAIARIQQKAIWVSVALILQSMNEIDHGWYFPYLGPLASFVPIALFLGSFYALWRALRPEKKDSRVEDHKIEVKPWQRVVLIITILLALIGGTLGLSFTIYDSFGPPVFFNDGTSLDTNAAILLLEGYDPYTDSSLPELLNRFTVLDSHPEWTTPLRQGQFANRLDYPGMTEIQSVLNTSLKANNDVPEFEAKVSYPALSFLTLLPFVLTQHDNVLPFYLLSYLLLIAIAWKANRPEIRPWILLLGMANIPMWDSTVGGNLDIFYTLLLVIAWIKRDQLWISAIFFGLSIATKQIAWYFAPFYLIMCIRHYGWRDALERLVITCGLALLINLPFIIWNPESWFDGIMAPIKDPMFPMGIGIVDLSITHLIPFLPEKVYSALEYSSMAVCLVYYWRTCKRLPETALLLAVVPLFFAWRSLPSYFYCIAFPIFIILTAQRSLGFAQALDYAKLQLQKVGKMKLTASAIRSI